MMEATFVDMLFSLSVCHIPQKRTDYYCKILDDTLYFKERLQKSESDQWRVSLNTNTRAYLEIVNLPRYNQEKHDALNDRPPFDTRVCRLCSVPVSPFSNQDILLLVFYGFKVICERTDLPFNRGDNIYNSWLETGVARQ